MTLLLAGVALLWFLAGVTAMLLGLSAGSIFVVPPEKSERQVRIFELASTTALLVFFAALLTLLFANRTANTLVDAACDPASLPRNGAPE